MSATKKKYPLVSIRFSGPETERIAAGRPLLSEELGLPLSQSAFVRYAVVKLLNELEAKAAARAAAAAGGRDGP